MNEQRQRSVRGKIEELRAVVHSDPDMRVVLEEHEQLLGQLDREMQELQRELDRALAER